MNCMHEADANLAPDAQDDDEFRPEPGHRKPDLNLGRHNTGLLALLHEKIRGNLSIEEQRSLGNSVTGLTFRIVYVGDQQRTALIRPLPQENQPTA
jgi:hypothetical protein